MTFLINLASYFLGLNALQKIFLASAVLGGTLFVIRILFMLFGGDTDSDIDMDGDTDISHGDTDSSFRILSLQGLTSFFMMFGLVGLALSELSGIMAIFGGLIAGTFTVWLIGKIFVGMKRLQSDGTIHMTSAIGEEGTVYLTIPAEGTGKIQLSIQERLKVMNAVSFNKEEIKTGERVTVVNVIRGNIMVVEKI